jgi:hypothetical protein
MLQHTWPLCVAVSSLHLKFQTHRLVRITPQQTQRPLSAFSAFRADPEPSAQVAHAQTRFAAGQIPDISLPNTLADADVHESIPL